VSDAAGRKTFNREPREMHERLKCAQFTPAKLLTETGEVHKVYFQPANFNLGKIKRENHNMNSGLLAKSIRREALSP